MTDPREITPDDVRPGDTIEVERTTTSSEDCTTTQIHRFTVKAIEYGYRNQPIARFGPSSDYHQGTRGLTPEDTIRLIDRPQVQPDEPEELLTVVRSADGQRFIKWSNSVTSKRWFNVGQTILFQQGIDWADITAFGPVEEPMPPVTAARNFDIPDLTVVARNMWEDALAECTRLADLLDRCCDLYWCPTVDEVECGIHGGFGTCCSFPGRHEDPEHAIKRSKAKNRKLKKRQSKGQKDLILTAEDEEPPEGSIVAKDGSANTPLIRGVNGEWWSGATPKAWGNIAKPVRLLRRGWNG